VLKGRTVDDRHQSKHDQKHNPGNQVASTFPRSTDSGPFFDRRPFGDSGAVPPGHLSAPQQTLGSYEDHNQKQEEDPQLFVLGCKVEARDVLNQSHQKSCDQRAAY
jgi:hypothetical protein